MIHVDKGAVKVDGTGKELLAEITVLSLALARNNVIENVNVFDLIRGSVGIAEKMFNKTKTEAIDTIAKHFTENM